MSEKSFHIPSLDGVRAIAVLLVFFSHSGYHHIVPGGLGVTIFFFLSGFLITTLLVREFNRDAKINFKAFYLRRIYRLFPPLYIVIGLTWLLCLIGFFKTELTALGLGAQLFQLTNYFIILEGKAGMLPGLGILWSLAVEEHFYLVFPILLLFLLRKSATVLGVTLISICIAALAWRFIYIYQFGLPSDYPALGSYAYTYYASETRVDSLLYGAIMAIFYNPCNHSLKKHSQPTLYICVAVSIAALLFSLLYRNPEFRETWRYTLQGVAMMPLFYFAISHSKLWLFKPLNWKPLVFIGKISYTFYLSHFVIIYIASKLLGDTFFAKNVVALVGTIIFSTVMYYYVEQHFASLRKKLHS